MVPVDVDGQICHFCSQVFVPCHRSNRGFVDTDKLYFLLHLLHEFPTPPLYESTDQPILVLVRVTDFSGSHNFLSILLLSLVVTTLVESSILVRECHDLNSLASDLSNLVPLKLPPIPHNFSWCFHVRSAGASMSELLVLSCEQSSFERGEEGADGPLLQAPC